MVLNYVLFSNTFVLIFVGVSVPSLPILEPASTPKPEPLVLQPPTSVSLSIGEIAHSVENEKHSDNTSGRHRSPSYSPSGSDSEQQSHSSRRSSGSTSQRDYGDYRHKGSMDRFHTGWRDRGRGGYYGQYRERYEKNDRDRDRDFYKGQHRDKERDSKREKERLQIVDDSVETGEIVENCKQDSPSTTLASSGNIPVLQILPNVVKSPNTLQRLADRDSKLEKNADISTASISTEQSSSAGKFGDISASSQPTHPLAGYSTPSRLSWPRSIQHIPILDIPPDSKHQHRSNRQLQSISSDDIREPPSKRQRYLFVMVIGSQQI